MINFYYRNTRIDIIADYSGRGQTAAARQTKQKGKKKKNRQTDLCGMINGRVAFHGTIFDRCILLQNL